MSLLNELQPKLIEHAHELVGKTISKAIDSLYDNWICLHFTDETAVVISATTGYELGDHEITLRQNRLKLDKYELKDMEFITESQFKALERRDEENRKKREKEAKRQQYEMLRREFEAPQNKEI